MTIEELKEKQLIVLDCISGSRAYGLATPKSDTDIKGVFVLPKKQYYSLDYIPQINDATNDVMYYELGRFIELLYANNPNILELLNTPTDCILYKHPLMESVKPELFLSKLCKNTFGKFAMSQIKKAKGLKKKIVNPMGEERKSVLEFCYVNYNNGSIPLLKFLSIKNWKQSDCGLSNINHMKDLYMLFHSLEIQYKGIVKNESSNELSLSSIPNGEENAAILYFNKDGYSNYCKQYKEYWDWVEKRNEVRYENTKSHGKNYDAKNMMHTFRLLEMAIDIGKEKCINVRRSNRDFLLEIKSGKHEYDTLLEMANERQLLMETAFANSDLREQPDKQEVNQFLFELRNQFYNS